MRETRCDSASCRRTDQAQVARADELASAAERAVSDHQITLVVRVLPERGAT